MAYSIPGRLVDLSSRSINWYRLLAVTSLNLFAVLGDLSRPACRRLLLRNASYLIL